MFYERVWVFELPVDKGFNVNVAGFGTAEPAAKIQAFPKVLYQ